jgi:orotidine-5'-phosphate decarboxylase
MQTFSERLFDAQVLTGSALCVGLDPDPDRLPAHLLASRTPEAAVEHFCRRVIEATADSACAFKLNFAFFERLGDAGLGVMRRVLGAIPQHALTIADAKRGDIGNSARFYAGSALDDLGFDSVTVSPYMGRDSIDPFIEDPRKAAFLLVRTSNPGRVDLQDLVVEGRPLYEAVARRALGWSRPGNGQLGFVVGASDIEALERLREIAPTTAFLIPGVGAQGGSPEQVMAASGRLPGLTLVNSSRAICYASSGDDFAAAAGRAAALAAKSLSLQTSALHE